jgi:hypothetical protein
VISERFLTWLGLAALIGSGILSALIEMLLIPLYAGATLVPITVAFAVGGNVLLLYLGRELAPDTGWRLSPFAGWLLTIIVFALFTRPEGDVIVPGGGGGVEWVGYGVLLGGALAGTVAAVMLSPAPRQRTVQATAAATPAAEPPKP